LKEGVVLYAVSIPYLQALVLVRVGEPLTRFLMNEKIQQLLTLAQQPKIEIDRMELISLVTGLVTELKNPDAMVPEELWMQTPQELRKLMLCLFAEDFVKSI
jgi:hypothetical protein